MMPNPLCRRVGFTVLELLVVVVVIAVLMGLTIVGANKAMIAMKQKATINEIGQLASSLESLKAKTGRYPPCMGAVTSSQIPSSSNLQDRGQRFGSFVRAAYPRCTVGASIGFTAYVILAGNDGTTNPIGTFPYLYNYRTQSGTVAYLDIKSMDQAESLVFWLGGFPSPVAMTGTGTPVMISTRKLIGFNADPSNPFRLDVGSAMLTSRTVPLFDFDDTRLTDSDNDGWLEYVPRGNSSTANMAPYVYFDADLYTKLVMPSDLVPYNVYPTLGSTAPSTSVVAPLITAQIKQWGVVGPYAANNLQSGASGAPISWINPNSFQIVCAGYDGLYGSTLTLPPPYRIAAPSTGMSYTSSNFNQQGVTSNFDQAGPLDANEGDNLTNFADSLLQDAIAQ